MPHVICEQLRGSERAKHRLVLAATTCLVLGISLASIKPLLEYEWFGWTMVCKRSGPFPNQCYSAPTIRDRLGLSPFDPTYPRLHFMPLIELSEVVDVGPSAFLEHCWFITTTRGHYYVPLYDDCEVGPPGGPEVDRVVARFTHFLTSRDDEFRYRARGTLFDFARGFTVGTQVVAGVLLGLSVSLGGLAFWKRAR